MNVLPLGLQMGHKLRQGFPVSCIQHRRFIIKVKDLDVEVAGRSQQFASRGGLPLAFNPSRLMFLVLSVRSHGETESSAC